MLPTEQHIAMGARSAAQPGMASPVPAWPGCRLTAARSQQGHPVSPQEEVKYLPQDIPLTYQTASCFTSSSCLSICLLRLLLGNVFCFLPRVRFSQVTLALPPLAEQNEKGPLWYDKLWHSGEDTETLLRNGS